MHPSNRLSLPQHLMRLYLSLVVLALSFVLTVRSAGAQVILKEPVEIRFDGSAPTAPIARTVSTSFEPYFIPPGSGWVYSSKLPLS